MMPNVWGAGAARCGAVISDAFPTGLVSPFAFPVGVCFLSGIYSWQRSGTGGVARGGLGLYGPRGSGSPISDQPLAGSMSQCFWQSVLLALGSKLFHLALSKEL